MSMFKEFYNKLLAIKIVLQNILGNPPASGSPVSTHLSNSVLFYGVNQMAEFNIL
jgi:hypothetical protein